jgi:hypothetical protein
MNYARGGIIPHSQDASENGGGLIIHSQDASENGSLMNYARGGLMPHSQDASENGASENGGLIHDVSFNSMYKCIVV